jgi:integrase
LFRPHSAQNLVDQLVGAITIDQLCEHFQQSEMRSGISLWSIATQKTYRGYIRRWIRPRWGSHCLDEVKAVEVEAWLGGLNLARGSRAKIRNVLCALYNHACRHGLFDSSPIRFVRQSAKRRRVPDLLTGTEIKVLVENLPHRAHTGAASCINWVETGRTLRSEIARHRFRT